MPSSGPAAIGLATHPGRAMPDADIRVAATAPENGQPDGEHGQAKRAAVLAFRTRALAQRHH